MPRNAIPCQKGLSLPGFLAASGTEERCARALFRARWPRGFPCPACGSGKHCRLRGRKALPRIRCKHQTSVTAGTLLAHTKLPLTAWFLALHLLPQAQNGLSARELMRQLGVSCNTAWMLNPKLRQALRERDASQPLHGTVELDDAYLGGAALGAAARPARRRAWRRRK